MEELVRKLCSTYGIPYKERHLTEIKSLHTWFETHVVSDPNCTGIPKKEFKLVNNKWELHLSYLSNHKRIVRKINNRYTNIYESAEINTQEKLNDLINELKSST